MRKAVVLFVIALAVAGVSAEAGVPPMMNYQGKLMQPSGAAVPDGTYSMQFAIYDVPTNGTALWSETNASVQVKGGLFAVLLGSVTNLPANIFDNPSRFFGVKIGTDPEMTPRQQVASSAFAFRAAVAGTVDDGAITTGKIADGAVDATKLSATAIKLGYAQLITGFSTSSTTDVQVPGLSATVTIPPGGRSVRITVYAGVVNSNNDAGQNNALTIWDGTVGSGTQLNIGIVHGGNTSMNSMFVQAITTPSTGTHTYNVGMRVDGSQGNIFAGPTQPAFILVELI